MTTKKSQPIDGLVLQRKSSQPAKQTYATSKAERQAAVVRANQPKKPLPKPPTVNKTVQQPVAKPSLSNPTVPKTDTTQITTKPAKREWIIVVVTVVVLMAIVAGILWLLMGLGL
jgi:hypothetical protein